MAVRYFILMCGILFVSSSWANIERKEFPAGSIHEVNLELDRGNITIQAGEADNIVFEVDRSKLGEHCRVRYDQDGSELELDIQDSSWFLGRRPCQAQVKLTLPAKTKVNVELGKGDIVASGLNSDFDVDQGSGNLNLKGEFTELDINLGSGDILVAGSAQDAEMKLGKGNVEMTFQKIPEIGRLEINSGVGNTVLNYPAGTKIKTNILSAVGKIENAFGDDPEAAYKFKWKSGLGDLKINSVE